MTNIQGVIENRLTCGYEHTYNAKARFKNIGFVALLTICAILNGCAAGTNIHDEETNGSFLSRDTVSVLFFPSIDVSGVPNDCQKEYATFINSVKQDFPSFAANNFELTVRTDFINSLDDVSSVLAKGKQPNNALIMVVTPTEVNFRGVGFMYLVRFKVQLKYYDRNETIHSYILNTYATGLGNSALSQSNSKTVFLEELGSQLLKVRGL